MLKIITSLSILLGLSGFLSATTTGATTRNVSIDGTIQGQNSATNGTNGASWETNEARVTSTSGADLYLTWDDNNLYVGWVGGNKDQQHILWIDTDPNLVPTDGSGSTSTFNYGNITATLPFTGNFFVNIQASYNEYRTNTGGTWSAGTSSALTVFSINLNDVEAIIPWNTITAGGGKPSSIYFFSYINDPTGGGGTGFVYAISPSTNTNSGGGNQTFIHYWGQDVLSGIDPFGAEDASLPVELSAFSAISGKGQIELKWRTESEIDNIGFIVLRSLGENDMYTEISNFSYNEDLIGAGTSSARNDYTFIDQNIDGGKTYFYKLIDVDLNGRKLEHGPVSAKASILSAGELAGSATLNFLLQQNYPNPFNPETWITFALPETNQVAERIKIEIFNIQGQLIATPFDKHIVSGTFKVLWQGTNQDGKAVPSGTYFYRLSSKNFNTARRMLMLK